MQTGEREFTVEGRHVSYGWYMLTFWLFRLASVAGFYFLGKKLYAEYWHWQDATILLLGYFVGYAVLTMAIPFPRLLCWLFLRRRTRVLLSPEKIVVNGRKRNLLAPVKVQFRASRNRLTDRELGRYPKIANYLARFRVIEMVYGLEIVPIASIDDEDRAAQFAVALQYAYDLVKAPPKTAPHAVMAGLVMAHDDLPE